MICELERNNGNAVYVVPMILESAPRRGRHELVSIFCCNNSIAILHDWFHGASDFSHEYYLEHRRSLPVIRLLVMRMSRKHNGHASFIDGHCR